MHFDRATPSQFSLDHRGCVTDLTNAEIRRMAGQIAVSRVCEDKRTVRDAQRGGGSGGRQPRRNQPYVDLEFDGGARSRIQINYARSAGILQPGHGIILHSSMSSHRRSGGAHRVNLTTTNSVASSDNSPAHCCVPLFQEPRRAASAGVRVECE